MRSRQQQHGNAELARHLVPQAARNNAAQIQRDDREFTVARRQYQSLGVQRVMNAVGRTAFAVRVAVHRSVEGRRNVFRRDARAKREIVRPRADRRENRDKEESKHV